MMNSYLTQTYVNKEIQGIFNQICELFCLDKEYRPELILRPFRDNQTGQYDPRDNTITMGCKKGLRLTTLVHELLHATGYDHQDDTSAGGNYRSNCTKDSLSPLIVKDLTYPYSVKELIL